MNLKTVLKNICSSDTTLSKIPQDYDYDAMLDETMSDNYLHSALEKYLEDTISSEPF